MKKIFIFLSLFVSFIACNGLKGELQKVANERLDSISQKVTSLGGECKPKEIVINDSLCLYSLSIQYPDVKQEMKVDHFFVRARKNNEYIYYEGSCVSPVEESLSDRVIEKMSKRGETINELLKGEETKDVVRNMLYEVAYEICIQYGDKAVIKK